MGKLARHLHVGVRGALSVALEQEKLQAGDAVTGNVCLRLEKPVEGQLTVCVRGEQQLRWNTQSGDHKTPHRRVLRHLELTEVLEVDGTMFMEGKVDYPITFQLPDHLPPTLLYSQRQIRDLHDVIVTVEYTVEATLVVNALMIADLISATSFTIEIPPSVLVEEIKPIAAREDRVVKLLGLLKRGTCHVSLELPRDVFDATSMIEARVTLHLQTTRRLKYIILALFEDATVDRRQERRLKAGSRIVGRRRFEASALAYSSNNVLDTMLRLPITPNDIYGFKTLTPTQQTHFLTIKYGVLVDCHFAKAPKVRVFVPIKIVPVDSRNIAAAS